MTLTAEQVAERKKHVGASEVAAVLGRLEQSDRRSATAEIADGLEATMGRLATALGEMSARLERFDPQDSKAQVATLTPNGGDRPTLHRLADVARRAEDLAGLADNLVVRIARVL